MSSYLSEELKSLSITEQYYPCYQYTTDEAQMPEPTLCITQPLDHEVECIHFRSRLQVWCQKYSVYYVYIRLDHLC